MNKIQQFLYDGSPRAVQRWVDRRAGIAIGLAVPASPHRNVPSIAQAYREAGLAMAGQNPALASREVQREATRRTIHKMAELGRAYRPAKAQEQAQKEDRQQSMVFVMR